MVCQGMRGNAIGENHWWGKAPEGLEHYNEAHDIRRAASTDRPKNVPSRDPAYGAKCAKAFDTSLAICQLVPTFVGLTYI